MRHAMSRSRECMTDERVFYELSSSVGLVDVDETAMKAAASSPPLLLTSRREFVARACEMRGSEWPTAWIRAGDIMYEEGEHEGAKLAYLVAEWYNRNR